MQISEYFQLRLRLPVSHAIVLQGLDQWFGLGLISELTWRSLPQQQPDRQIYLTVFKDKDKSDALFAGITAWVELGLLDDEQVLNICAKHLSSPLPDRVVAKTEVNIDQKSTLAESESLFSQIPSAVSSNSQSTARSPAIPGMLQALFSEFSTLWLLFLGVFLTVVSSGLLAASQWQNFSEIGQYLILFSYTLGFLGVSFVTGKKARLSLTTRALQLVTLLLVPANFWAIDGLGLLNNSMGISLGAIAGLILSGVTIFLLQNSFTGETSNRQYPRLNLLTAIAILLLGWTHLGWSKGIYPVVAVYIGIGAVATATFFNRNQKLNRDDISISLTKIVSAYGMILLVARGLLFGNVSYASLGLAIAICGWVLCQVDYQSELKTSESQELSISNQTSENVFEAKLGRILLFLGWLATIWDSYPWQAIAVSLLIAWLICDRLHQSKYPSELTKLFFWGLQILWLVSRLIPNQWYGELARFFQLSNYDNVPLVGVVLIPYLLFTLSFASIYRHHQHHALALRSEHLALGFGVFLSILSFAYPFTRFTNLTLSALILGFVMARRSPHSRDNQFLIYATHIVGLGAFASGIFTFYRLTLSGWAGILMVMMLVEWGMTWWLDIAKDRDMDDRLTKKLIWRDSAWQLSLCMSILSYFLIVIDFIRRSQLGQSIGFSSYAGLGWLTTMAILGLLGMRKSFADGDMATRFSIVGLVVGQYLTWQSDGMRTLGLAIALTMMLINTRRLSSLLSALITTGFGLALFGSILWQLKPDTDQIPLVTFGINGAVVSVILLFILNHWLKYRRDRQPSNHNLSIYSSYLQAFNLWAVLLSTVILLFQTFLTLLFFDFSNFGIPFWSQDISRQLFANLFLSTVLMTVGLIYRAWQEPVFWAEWGIGWGLELIVAGAIALNNGSVIELATANIGLGLTTQLLGDWWIRRTGQNRYPLSWNLIPLIYAIIGSLLRIGTFSSYTGLFTFGTALVAIGISRRAVEPPKLLIYISMVAATFGAYELLFYQMLAANRGDSWGDGLIILGVLGGAIAYIYQVFARWIMPYLKLSRSEINIFAHIHWFVSAVFLLAGSFFNPSASSGTIGVGLAIALTVYALSQGRKSDSTAEAWVYLGIGMGIVATVYQFAYASPNPWLNETILIPYSGAIAACVSTLFLICPWSAWGWSQRPWHRAALVLPIVFVLIYAGTIAVPCLLIVAIFYGIRTILSHQIRLSYLSVWLLAWVSFRFIAQYSYVQIFSYASVICFSVLYFSHVEASLKGRNSRGLNHTLRSIACGSLCLIAFLYSTNDVQMAAVTWGLSLGFAIAGLAMRVRAYLFTGTATFVLLVINQAVILVAQYGFLLWAIGIVAGISFITVAANFEVRRDRILAIARNILHELETWA